VPQRLRQIDAHDRARHPAELYIRDPSGFDQPQTARRMSRLGVATIIPWSRASASALERGLGNLLSRDSYRHRASAFATWLGQEGGLDNAADAIEQALTM
jgi:UDP:flavonoid glycosyltransferase YjiC (YdhE family)